MLATFSIEFALAAWVLLRYKLDTTGRIAVVSLLLLGTFQVIEYISCGTNDSRSLAVLGYLAITLLPALAIHLVARIAKVTLIVAWLAYAMAAVWFGVFLFVPDVIAVVQCTGNYNILTLDQTYATLYGLYYFGWLFGGLAASIYGVRRLTAQPERHALRWYAAAFLLLILPTWIVNVTWPVTIHGIPSIMCGFAITYALILSFRVMPLVGTRR